MRLCQFRRLIPIFFLLLFRDLFYSSLWILTCFKFVDRLLRIFDFPFLFCHWRLFGNWLCHDGRLIPIFFLLLFMGHFFYSLSIFVRFLLLQVRHFYYCLWILIFVVLLVRKLSIFDLTLHFSYWWISGRMLGNFILLILIFFFILDGRLFFCSLLILL